MTFRARYLLIGGVGLVAAVGLIGWHLWPRQRDILKPDGGPIVTVMDFARCFHYSRMDADVLRDRVHIPECSLKRTACVQRIRAGTEIEKIDSLRSAGNGMRCRQPYMGSLLHRSLASRDHCAPQPIEAVEQKQPGRAQVPSRFVLEFVWRALRLNEDIKSGSKVNRLVGEPVCQRMPPVDFAHGDLTGGEQCPE